MRQIWSPQMTDNTGIPYETLAQVVFQWIVNQSEVRNIKVQHDVTLQGTFTPHKIDVYWKFAIGRVEYETIVQAKDWKRPVDKGELMEFKGVLDDLPGQVKGIFVSRAGYQQGAVDFALGHGILLYELREADAEPNLVLQTTGWATFALFKTPLRVIENTTDVGISEKMYGLRFEYEVFTPSFSNIRFNAPTGWFENKYPAMEVTKLAELTLPTAFLHEINLFREDGNVADNLASVFQKLAMGIQKEGLEEKRTSQIFDEPTFIRTDSPLVPTVRVGDISVDIKIERRRVSRRGRMTNFVQWVLYELNSGRAEWFVATPSVTSQLPQKE
jgi:Restriction endonuclease